MSSEYSSMEMMAIALSRRIKNGDVVFCGTGLPMLAAVAAKLIHAPKCIIFFETGAMDPTLLEVPLTVADPRVMYNASHIGNLADAFSYMQNQITGKSVVGILSGAQIDIYGNLNSSMICDNENLRIRLPGSGGACDVATCVNKTFIFMKHETRRFVEKLDYLTSPGWLSGGTSRKEAGIRGGGPECVITSLGVLRFEDDSKKMILESYYEFTSPDEIRNNTGFLVRTSQARLENPPTSKELEVLREKVDPLNLILQ
ncbi:MAG: CoA-transferase subunit beta [Candidatus Thorarchaeota archaeon]